MREHKANGHGHRGSGGSGAIVTAAWAAGPAAEGVLGRGRAAAAALPFPVARERVAEGCPLCYQQQRWGVGCCQPHARAVCCVSSNSGSRRWPSVC